MNREKAIELLTHYLRLPFEAAGLGWDGDNYGEVEQIVDALLGKVDDLIRQHTENAPHLHPDGSRS